MWFFSLYKFISIYTKTKDLKQKYYIYHPIFKMYLSFFCYRKWNKYVYISKYLNLKKLLTMTFETKFIRFKSVGKIFRIVRKKKVFILSLNYTGFTYLIWKDLKIKRIKKKKLYIIRCLTNSDIRSNFFYNLLRLRILDTYTKRGVYNNLYAFYFRKKRILSHR